MVTVKFVRIKSEYCDYLRQFDSCVVYNKNKKELRPFIGVLFVVNNCEYFAPLSSPKSKHLTMKDYVDFIKIKNGELGVVNFNNMIPVKDNNYDLIDLNNDEYLCKNLKYKNLLRQQFIWINENYNLVQRKALKLYDLYNSGRLNVNVKSRCCDFKLLESKCESYNKSQVR